MGSEKRFKDDKFKASEVGTKKIIKKYDKMLAISQSLEKYRQQIQQINETFQRTQGYSNYINDMVRIQENLARAAKPVYQSLGLILKSSILREIHELNKSFAIILGSTSPTIQTAWRLSQAAEEWRKLSITPLKQIQDSLALVQSHYNSHLAYIAKLSILTECSLSRFKIQSIGINLGLSAQFRSKLAKLLEASSKCYTRLLTEYLDKDNVLIESPVISKTTAEDFYSQSDLFEVISAPEPDAQLEKEKTIVRREIATQTDNRLTELLQKVNKQLVQILQGARSALESDNPDRIRHFAVSFRELFTHIIRALAPDENVKNWTSERTFFHNNIPTRKARILYICRNIKNKHYKRFLEKDIDAVLALLNIFQQGTHEIDAKLAPSLLPILKLRMEIAIQALLEINFLCSDTISLELERE